MIKEYVESLIRYEISKEVISNSDYFYVRNQLYSLLKLEDDGNEVSYSDLSYPSDALEPILDDLEKRNIIDGSKIARDLFDCKIMNTFVMLPKSVIEKFGELEKDSPKKALTWFYKYMQDVNYIRKNRTDQNKMFDYKSQYGNIQITINVSKPEKDPKSIALALKNKSSSYPKNVISRQNEGFSGNFQREARDNLRLIPLNLSNENWFLQYSPYIYYNEHAIILSEEIRPMVINNKTFKNLLLLVEKFNHYFFGSNADLPIVGGSILSHDHYQAGNYHFPIEDAEILETFKSDDLNISMIKWPLSTIRVESTNIDKLVSFASKTLEDWKNYENKELSLLPYTNDTRHHTITPIARMKNGKYQLDLVLRSNYTSDTYPLGYFHPHEDVWSIKKENIGLIEVMGLAILPARLIKELELVKEAILNKEPLSEDISHHKGFVERVLKNKNITKENINEMVENEVGRTFTKGLTDAGVFKLDDLGKLEFKKFIEGLIK